MSALPIVPHLDVLENVSLGLGLAMVVPVMHQFLLECSKEPLHRRIVVAVALPAHTAKHTMPGKQFLVIPAGVRTASIAVME